ncbi:MAG: hypothetical protein KAI47_03890 [Deltaproteobacteria bacterium]|nr:hypothetical protein [Deltaproteobacteria bacterium]
MIVAVMTAWIVLIALLLRFYPNLRQYPSTWAWRRRSPMMESIMGFYEGFVVGPGDLGDLVYPPVSGPLSRRTLVHLAQDKAPSASGEHETIAISPGSQWTGEPRLYVGQRLAVQGFPIAVATESTYREPASMRVTNAFRLKTFSSHRRQNLAIVFWTTAALVASTTLSFGTALVIA